MAQIESTTLILKILHYFGAILNIFYIFFLLLLHPLGDSLDLGAQAVAIVRQDKLLWVATMDKMVSCYTGERRGEGRGRVEGEVRGGRG